ncbi:MAG: DUF6179 domain-containing protein [Methanomassiliicoccales archaeon]
MEHSIANISSLRVQALNPNQYLLSLLQEAYFAELISQPEMNNIQGQIMEVLKDIIIRSTGGESSSVRTETAQNLLNSVLYCLDAYCMSFATPEECILALKNSDLKVMHEKGRALVQSWVKETKLLYYEVKATRVDTTLIAYNDTIDEAIPDFFSGYNVLYNAHDIMASIDYQLASGDLSSTGVLYIRQYLENLKMENQFCLLFSKSDITRLLKSYGRVYRINYQEFLLNIFEIVLSNAVFSVMSGNKASKLIVPSSAINRLQKMLENLDASEIILLFNRALDQMIIELGITGLALNHYIHECGRGLIPRLINALQQNTLRNLIISEEVTEDRPVIRFEQGEIMDNEAFRLLIDLVMEEADSLKKADLILAGVKSLADFVDILNSDCLYDDDYPSLFSLLGDLELSTLARIVFADELREDTIMLVNHIASLTVPDKEWENQLVKFLRTISTHRVAIIEKLLNTPSDFSDFNELAEDK